MNNNLQVSVEPVFAYHGSGVSIDEFDYKFTEIGNDQLGSGFYFTTKEAEAAHYTTALLNGEAKPGGMSNPTIHEVHLHCKNFMHYKHEMEFKPKDIEAIIRRSPILDEQLEAYWGEIEFTGRDKLIKEAVESYSSLDSKDKLVAIKNFNELSTDFYPGYTREFFEVIRELYQFDGVVCDFDAHTHYVAWFNEDIEILDRKSPELSELDADSKRPKP